MVGSIQRLFTHPAFERAGKRLADWDGHLSIVSHYDTDGICAGTIMMKAMISAGRPCSLRLLREFRIAEMERALEAGMLVLLDMGTGQLRELEELEGSRIIVLDHHQPPEPHDARDIAELNAHKLGFDGTYEACASTLSYVFTLKLDENNARNIGDAIIGITGDRQHVPELSGLNRDIVMDGIERGFIQEKQGELSLHEHEVGESLGKGTDPYFTNLSGREENVKGFMDRLGISPEQKMDELDPERKKRLTEALLLRLLRRCNHVTVKELLCTKYFTDPYPVSAHSMCEYVNACGRTGNETLAVKMLLGNSDALGEAISIFENYRSEIQNALIYLEDMGIKRQGSIQYFINTNPAKSGTLAGIGMQYIFDQSRPTLGMAVKDGKFFISGRGTTPLIEKGLDLATAFKISAEKLEGKGGGHPIAAGASIPADGKDEFLKEVDSIVRDQLGN